MSYYSGQKGPKQDTTSFVVFHPPTSELFNSTLSTLRDEKKETIVCLSIDVGIKNLAIRVEGRERRGKGRFTRFAPPTYIEPFFFGVHNLSGESETTGTTNVDPSVFIASIEIMDKLLSEVPRIDLIVVERQLAINVKSSRMFQHLITYLLISIQLGKINNNVILLDVYPGLKYNQLGPPPSHLNKKGKKLWGIEIAKKVLEKGTDMWSNNMIHTHEKQPKSKADDLADTVIQLEAILQKLDL